MEPTILIVSSKPAQAAQLRDELGRYDRDYLRDVRRREPASP